MGFLGQPPRPSYLSRRHVLAAGAAAAFSLSRLRRLYAAGPPTTLVVVVNPASGITEIGLDLLRAVFSGDPVSRGSIDRLVPLNDAVGAAERVEFDRKVLRMEPAEVGRFWVDRRIRGQGAAPRIVPAADLRQRFLERFLQAITYVRSGEVLPAVHIVKINGKLPGEPGYPL